MDEHCTDGRKCWCDPQVKDGIVIHKSAQEIAEERDTLRAKASKRIETEDKREGLAACPFCGCRDAVLVTCEMDGLPELEADYFVRCNHCFAQGPNRMSESQAIAEWNRGAD